MPGIRRKGRNNERCNMYGGISDWKYSEQSIWSMECISDNAVAVYDSGLHYWTCGGGARLLPYP